MQTAPLSFIKMHGIGNDFVILDARAQEMTLSTSAIKNISNRKTGIGCDQLIILRNTPNADIRMGIYNADGSTSGACGNATRCIGWHQMEESCRDEASIETEAGILYATRAGGQLVTINMGKPSLAWQDIPLSREIDTHHLPIEASELKDPVAVNMGNPHVVFFVPTCQDVPLETHGPKIEHDELFPERVNVNVATVVSRNAINLRVWERGVGETQACGSGACATMVAAHTRGLVGDTVDITLPGGTLQIAYSGEEVMMTGPIAYVCTGYIDESLLT